MALRWDFSLQAGFQQQARQLCDPLQHQHPRHDRPARKVVVEKIFTQGHILDRLRGLRDFPARDAVDEEESHGGSLAFRCSFLLPKGEEYLFCGKIAKSGNAVVSVRRPVGTQMLTRPRIDSPIIPSAAGGTNLCAAKGSLVPSYCSRGGLAGTVSRDLPFARSQSFRSGSGRSPIKSRRQFHGLIPVRPISGRPVEVLIELESHDLTGWALAGAG